jgi:hypothetical protein
MNTSRCPACGRPFSLKFEAGRVLAWCAWGPCPSTVANAGAEGEDAQEAGAILFDRVQEDLARVDQERLDHTEAQDLANHRAARSLKFPWTSA